MSLELGGFYRAIKRSFDDDDENDDVARTMKYRNTSIKGFTWNEYFKVNGISSNARQLMEINKGQRHLT